MLKVSHTQLTKMSSTVFKNHSPFIYPCKASDNAPVYIHPCSVSVYVYRASCSCFVTIQQHLIYGVRLLMSALSVKSPSFFHYQYLFISFSFILTLWGRVTHICVSTLTIIGSDNGLSPDRRQAIIWTDVGLLLIGPLGTNFSEILIEILTFSFKKMRLKESSAKRRPFCLGLNVLMSLYIFCGTVGYIIYVLLYYFLNVLFGWTGLAVNPHSFPYP